MSEVKFGKVIEVEARNIWKDEALDFTPWLSENIDKIGEAIGDNLEVEATEATAGNFNIDILAKSNDTNKYVIIENQLSKTDHKHLGQCITYASVINASTIVWVSTEFNPEHQKALDWLNEHTSDDISFFGIKVKVIKIDNSEKALIFDVVSKPNEDFRRINKQKEEGKSGLRQIKFWNEFKSSFNKRTSSKTNKTPRPQSWFDVHVGSSELHIANLYKLRDGIVGTSIYLKEAKANEWLNFFMMKKEEIESKMEAQLLWNPKPENKNLTISLEKRFDLEKNENQAIDWLVDKTISLQKILKKLIRQKNHP